MSKLSENIPPSWQNPLRQITDSENFGNLCSFLKEERKNYRVFPAEKEVFQALELTPFQKVKVVVIGQDPYHGEGQAHGLAFSVKKGVKHPPSLKNIFIELKNDLDIETSQCGNLSDWAKQGVLLLNTVLTVRKGEAASHASRGWEQFTDACIRSLSENSPSLLFVLWGKPAQKKAELIDTNKHDIIALPHPSPLSAYRGFFGSKVFSRINQWLKEHGKKPIDWRLE